MTFARLTFRLSPDADTNGTSLEGYVSVVPAKVVEVFAGGREADSYKVSRSWAFESSVGDVFTLYEYKQTSLYDTRNPSPDRFWGQRRAVLLHIGGRDDRHIDEFKAWLAQKLG